MVIAAQEPVVVYGPQEIDWGSLFNVFAFALVVGMAAPMFYPHQSPMEELEDLNERIRKTGYVRDNYKRTVQRLRTKRISLMKEYGLSVAPPLADLRTKYRDLYVTERDLKDAEEELDRVELRIILMSKRRKELMIALGMREED